MLYNKDQVVVVYGFVNKVIEVPKVNGGCYKVLPIGHNYGDYRCVFEKNIRPFEVLKYE